MKSSRCKCGKWTDGVGKKLCWECRRKKYGDRITQGEPVFGRQQYEKGEPEVIRQQGGVGEPVWKR